MTCAMLNTKAEDIEQLLLLAKGLVTLPAVRLHSLSLH